MYTSGSKANSQRILTVINESDTKAKIGISGESDTIKHLKAFRIIYGKMSISLLALSW